ncbi:MAG: Arc family DNA binding domain-containing protein [Bacteroidetes bacterium]|nr:MAG: Arc family DNA binding domain-containing protein [Bacteroidota bacterium]
MAKKKAFVLRVSPEMMASLEKWAQDEFRSINGQIEYLLHDALKKTGRLKKKKE